MRYLDLPHACLLLVAICLGHEAAATVHDGVHTHRVLRAATKRSDLYRRSMRITKRFESELAYIEAENGWNGKSTFASQVKVSSEKPVLSLEEIEHHLQDVQCEHGKMRLGFVDTSSARDAYFTCRGNGGGLIITSHDSCNVEGERAVYKVHDVSFANEGEALELLVTETPWQDAFDHFDISFGHTTDDHLYRRHSDFAKIRKKRQSIGIPSNTPDNITTATFDLASQLLDTTFAAESFLSGLEQLVSIPALPIEIGCNNCTTSGRIALTQGAISIDASQIDVIPDLFQGGDDGKEITSVITGGFFELAATGVGAHLDMFARPKVSGAFEIALFKLPILGFVIPGIGRAGAVFEPRIAVDFTVSGGFELNYGIDVAIPDDSKIRVELIDVTKSGAVGFPGSTLTPLPFSANVTDIDILLGLAFKPTIPVGFQFSDKLEAEVFVSMSLPRLDAKLSTNAAANCGNASNATVPDAPYKNQTTNVAGGLTSLGPLVLVEANISVTVDVGVGLSLPLLPPPFGEVETEANIFSTGYPLVTSCANPEDAFKTVTSIIASPTSAPYVNTTMKANPAESTSTIKSTTTTSCIKTVYITHTRAATSGYFNISTVAVKEPYVPNETPISFLLPEPPLSSVSSNSSTLLLDIPNPPSSSQSANITVTSAVATPPASAVVISSSLLQPSNNSIVPAQPTGVLQFSSAAVPGLEVPMMRWKEVGWQLSVLGMGIVFGALLL